ncbi:hypothetical protein BINDI_1382 [Bifidobacterium [indicum] DSM 20214 = LMG 11587]|uniref:Uncharacterized protein n=1 Tax=Bifidobacterium [indicum] DSM 20214 = LMG 11587 TaxID=1341694 RepID=A0A087VSF1_9BIFI|nr:hypothetical protein BINDI_1382 [Bifidobacterium indicum LMG 11587 = DSM 20214]
MMSKQGWASTCPVLREPFGYHMQVMTQNRQFMSGKSSSKVSAWFTGDMA